jgi:hypothetical protein
MVVDFTRLDRLFSALDNLTEDKIWFFAVDKDVQDEIIRINTEDQLEEEGIDSLGRKLGDYAPSTIAYKRRKGQRYDHVTLKDEGDFYNSFNVKVNVNEIIIDADDSSKYNKPLFEVWGVDVLGLTDDNMNYIKQMILENYINFVLNELLSDN